MNLRALWLAVLLVMAFAMPAGAGPYYIMLGSRVVATDHLPVFFLDGKDYVCISLLDELGFSAPLPTDGQDEPPPHYDPDEGTQPPSGASVKEGDSTIVSLIQEPLPQDIPEIGPGLKRYRIGAHVLDIPLDGKDILARLDGQDLPPGIWLSTKATAIWRRTSWEN